MSTKLSYGSAVGSSPSLVRGAERQQRFVISLPNTSGARRNVKAKGTVGEPGPDQRARAKSRSPKWQTRAKRGSAADCDPAEETMSSISEQSREIGQCGWLVSKGAGGLEHPTPPNSATAALYFQPEFDRLVVSRRCWTGPFRTGFQCVIRQIVPLASSDTRSAPSCATVTPTGLPHTSESLMTKPVRKSWYSPVGDPSFRGIRMTL